MKEDRPWGSFIVVYEGTGYKVKVLEVNPGERLSYQSHSHRSERWYILRGKAGIVMDDEEIFRGEGEFVHVDRGSKHRLENKGDQMLIVIEVQLGEILDEEDIIRYQDDYDRHVRVPEKEDE